MPKIGDVRIVKADSMNYAVEEYREGKVMRGDRKGEVTVGWREVGYYGDKLEWAVNSALMQKVTDGKALLGEFRQAARDIIAAMKEN